MQPIQRYNQGFGFFGRLEKCATGKLAYYAALEALIADLGKQAAEDKDRRIIAEEWAEKRTKQVLELTAANEALQKSIVALQTGSDVQYENADALAFDVQEADRQLAKLKSELADTKRDKKILFCLYVLAALVAGAALSMAYL